MIDCVKLHGNILMPFSVIRLPFYVFYDSKESKNHHDIGMTLHPAFRDAFFDDNRHKSKR